MESTGLDELAGRIDGVAQAVLRLTAQLEMDGFMLGPQLTQAWREARPENFALGVQLQASRKVLLQMAEQLDAARESRQQRKAENTSGRFESPPNLLH
jgi:hypothetical protein